MDKGMRLSLSRASQPVGRYRDRNFPVLHRQHIILFRGAHCGVIGPDALSTYPDEGEEHCMVKLSIIIPAYNERQTIEDIIELVHQAPIDAPVEVEKEILVVDDGSTDGTREILQELAQKYPDIKVFMHERNQGKGAAIRTALQHATGDYIVIQDADLEYDPREFGVLLRPLLEGKADVVYGSRFLGPHRAFLFVHYLGNKFLNLITNILYDTILTDMETCYKMFRADVIKDIPLHARGFEFEPEVTAKVLKRGYRVFEVPISYSGRDFEEGKKIHPWKDGLRALWTLIKYRFVD